MKRAFDIGRPRKPVSSVLRRSPKLDMAKSLPREQRSRRRVQKLPVACTRIANKPLSISLVGNAIEINVFHSRFNELEPAFNETHVVTPIVLEDWIKRIDRLVAARFSLAATSETGRSVRCLFVSRSERAELLSNDTRLGPFDASCGRATRDDWNTESDP